MSAMLAFKMMRRGAQFVLTFFFAVGWVSASFAADLSNTDGVLKTEAETNALLFAKSMDGRCDSFFQVECSKVGNSASEGLKGQKQWCLRIQAGGACLISNPTNTSDSGIIEFDWGQDRAFVDILAKFLERDAVSRTNHSESINEELGHLNYTMLFREMSTVCISGKRVYSFEWDSQKAYLKIQNIDDIGPSLRSIDMLNRDDVVACKELLEKLPAMKATLVSSIQGKGLANK